jgi:hypothetical protein
MRGESSQETDRIDSYFEICPEDEIGLRSEIKWVVNDEYQWTQLSFYYFAVLGKSTGLDGCMLRFMLTL